ncbi:hypothetical protein J6A31_04645 [bacterium]|nr:hypothetical protein [bacterium]
MLRKHCVIMSVLCAICLTGCSSDTEPVSLESLQSESTTANAVVDSSIIQSVNSDVDAIMFDETAIDSSDIYSIMSYDEFMSKGIDSEFWSMSPHVVGFPSTKPSESDTFLIIHDGDEGMSYIQEYSDIWSISNDSIEVSSSGFEYHHGGYQTSIIKNGDNVVCLAISSPTFDSQLVVEDDECYIDKTSRTAYIVLGHKDIGYDVYEDIVSSVSAEKIRAESMSSHIFLAFDFEPEWDIDNVVIVTPELKD